jgi:hypothetical protein
MPLPTSNFSTPDNPYGQPIGGGQGAPENAVWDPVQQKWVGSVSGGQPGGGTGNQMPGPQPRPPGTTWDPNTKQFVAASQATSNAYSSPYGEVSGSKTVDGTAPTEGRVQGFDGSTRSGGTWGGYTGTNVRNPDGTITFDPTMNGATADIERMQGLGAAAANRSAYQIDYGQANQDASLGGQARQGQNHAAGLARSVALGQGTPGRNLGRSMLQQGVQTQRAAALSTRGGSLAQAAALRQQQNGQGAFMQQGEAQMQALQADEMAAARQQWMQELARKREQDAQAQGLNQKQAIGQMGQELEQRGLNQTGSLGYEEMGQNVDKAAQDASLKTHEINSGIDAAASLRSSQRADRNLRDVGAGFSAAGSGIAGLSGMASTNGESEEDRRRRYTTSDARAKQGARPLGLAAAAARRGSR